MRHIPRGTGGTAALIIQGSYGQPHQMSAVWRLDGYCDHGAVADHAGPLPHPAIDQPQ